MIVLKYAYVHGTLDVEDFDTIEGAVESANWAAERGEESLHSIEVVLDDGSVEVIGKDHEAWRRVAEREEAEWQRIRAAPPIIARLCIRPTVEANLPARFEQFTDMAQAKARYAELAPLLGERLTLEERHGDRVLDWKPVAV